MSDDFPNRQTVRLQKYDYSSNGLYFVTICTGNYENLFGEIENGIMVLNETGKIVETEILNTTIIRQNIKIDQYAIMPNHIHLIILIQNTTPPQTQIRRGVLHTPDHTPNTPDNDQNIISNDRNMIDNDQNSPGNDQNMIGNDQNIISNADLSKYIGMSVGSIVPNGVIGSNGFIGAGVSNTPLRGLQSPSQTIGTVVRGIKSAVTRRTNEIKNRKYFKLWQRNYHEHIIRDENSCNKIVSYIQNNPSKWQNDKFFRESP